jgi:RND family efflux transporter MFP subunit
MNTYGFIAGIACTALIMSGCTNRKETEHREKIIPVKVMDVSASTSANVRNYVGTIEESQAISLSFSNMGTVEQVLVTKGQKVRKGQLLAALNSTTAQNALDLAQAQLNQAQDAYDRLSKAHAGGSVSDIKFKEMESGLQQAKASVAISRKSLDDCKLYAPRDGIIAQRDIEAGANVMPGVSSFKLVTIDRVTANFPVPENEIGSTSIGQIAIVEVAALNGEKFEGKIEMKSVSANSISHAYEVKAGIDNGHAKLLPGMVCKISIVQDGAEAEIVIPNKVIQLASDGRKFVWITENALARRRFVTTGTLRDSGIAVSEGLHTGDRLIVEGYWKVSEGTKISITN